MSVADDLDLSTAQPVDRHVSDVSDRLDGLTHIIDVSHVWSTISRGTEWASSAPLQDRPTISVVLPTRNRAHLIRGAVASVLAQSYEHWELLIVNDGSTDDTAEIIAELAAADDRIHPIASTGIGGAGARNLGLDVVNGSIVTFLDDDNTMTPHWLRAVAEYMSRVPECDALYGAQLRVPITPGHHFPIDVFFAPTFDRTRLRENNFIDLGTLAVRNGHPELRFDPELRALQDWELIARIAEVTPLTPLPALASCYSSAAEDRISVVHGGDTAVALMRERFRLADNAQPG